MAFEKIDLCITLLDLSMLGLQSGLLGRHKIHELRIISRLRSLITRIRGHLLLSVGKSMWLLLLLVISRGPNQGPS